ncbi:MAG: hypothetical protein ABI333_09300 [bacterium]
MKGMSMGARALGILVGPLVLALGGCPSTDTGNGNNANQNNLNGYTLCADYLPCQDPNLTCCQTPDAPVIGGTLASICVPEGSCCNCGSGASCERCSGSQVCDTGLCLDPSCTHPECTSSNDCETDEFCCTSVTDGCEDCGGICHTPTSAQCTTVGWECGGGPYASAEPRGAWIRWHRKIGLPAHPEQQALLSATFRWRHDAGRPPPHELAVGLEGHSSPLFQVFSRDGKLFARFGLQVVHLSDKEGYRLQLSLRAERGGTQAQAVLVRLGDQRAVLEASAELSTPLRALWQEQYRLPSRQLGHRVSLLDFGVETAVEGDHSPDRSPCAVSDPGATRG